MVYLERLYKSPEKYSYGVTLAQQFNETGCSEKPEESQADEIVL